MADVVEKVSREKDRLDEVLTIREERAREFKMAEGKFRKQISKYETHLSNVETIMKQQRVEYEVELDKLRQEI